MRVREFVSRTVLDAVFPPQCALCGAGGALLCAACEAVLPRADGSRCVRCWMRLASGGVCRHCAEEPPAFMSLRAACVMDGGARRLAHELKYEGMTSLAEPMARMLASHAAGIDALVVPVPLHPARERRRGYNQAAELANHAGRMLGLSWDRRAVRRTRDTQPLVKAMGRAERRRIVAGAFLADPARVEGRAIVLIDDVATTGATLDACARALADAGATKVLALAWARAD